MEFPTISNDSIMGIVDEVKAKLENPLVALAGGVVLGAGITAGVSAIVKRRKKSSKKKKKFKSHRRKKSSRKHKRITHTSRGWKQDRKRRSKQKWEVAYQKRKKNKSSSRKGIHYTKNGQPYKILSNGRARFIKKRKN